MRFKLNNENSADSTKAMFYEIILQSREETSQFHHRKHKGSITNKRFAFLSILTFSLFARLYFFLHSVAEFSIVYVTFLLVSPRRAFLSKFLWDVLLPNEARVDK